MKIISGTVDIDPEQMEAAMTAAKPLIEARSPRRNHGL